MITGVGWRERIRREFQKENEDGKGAVSVMVMVMARGLTRGSTSATR